MPAAAITAIAGFLVTAGATAAVATFVATIFVYAASAVILNAASRALAPKRRGVGLGTGTEINYFDTAASVRIVYGQVKIGGMETLPPFTKGLNNRELNKLLTIAGHEVHSFVATHFDTATITPSQINTLTGSSTITGSGVDFNDGLVTTGSFANVAYIRHFRGNSLMQSFDPSLRLNSLDSNAKNISTVALTFIFNQSIFPAVPTVTFTLQGKRVYDPRLDVSPGASPTNSAYIAFGSNPALCLADFLLSNLGGGYDADEIDWTTVVTAANYCDALVNVPTGTQKRYTCNGVLFATDKFTDNVKSLVDAMLGRIIFRDGKWRLYAGSWQTPSFTIPKDAWVSGLSMRFEQGKEKRYNRVHCFYIDPARNYQRVECASQQDTGYQASDGQVNELETEQLMCTDEFEAQRKSVFLLRQSRNQIVVAGKLPPAYQDIAIWDTGTIVFDFLGWSSKTFRATSITVNPDGGVDGVFTEEQDFDWLDLDASFYNQFALLAPIINQPTTPSEPTSFSVAEQINGTLLFTIGTPIIRPVGTKFQLIRGINSADAFSSSFLIYEGDSNVVPLVQPTSTHWYWSRAIVGSLTSGLNPSTFGTMARTQPQAAHKFAKEVIPDPEFEFSSENGRFWVHTRSDMYSLSLSLPSNGGQGGSLIMQTASFLLISANAIYALPTSSFPRYINNRPVSVGVRFRAIKVSSRPTTAPDISIFGIVAGWNGNVSIPNCNFISLGNQGQIFVQSTTGVTITTPQPWQTAVYSVVPLTQDITSYPYMIFGLGIFPITNNVGLGGLNSGDTVEVEFANCNLL